MTLYDGDPNGREVRGNAYPHWGLKLIPAWTGILLGFVRGNAYPHWGLKLLR